MASGGPFFLSLPPQNSKVYLLVVAARDFDIRSKKTFPFQMHEHVFAKPNQIAVSSIK